MEKWEKQAGEDDIHPRPAGKTRDRILQTTVHGRHGEVSDVLFISLSLYLFIYRNTLALASRME